jgi:hypothetical protein
LHTIAKELGMTVRALSAELTVGEFLDWIAYFKVEAGETPAKPLEIGDLRKAFDG